MKRSSNSVRQIVLLALVWLGLLNMTGGPSYILYWSRSSITSHAVYPNNINNRASAANFSPPSDDKQAKSRASTAYANLPLRFEANAGQTDPQVKFLSRGRGYNLFLTPAEAILAMRTKNVKTGEDRQSIVRMKLLGANPRPQVEGIEQLPGRSNYLIGNDPGKWRRNVESYRKVRYRSVYPGIDLIYYGNGRQLEYDFVVAAGADPNAIKLDFDGANKIRMDQGGDLLLDTGGGEVRHRKAFVYQELNGRRQEIASQYVLAESGEVSFKIAAYDRKRPLVIDPVLSYATFLGSRDDEVAEAIDVDAAGNAYITGFTESLDFPTANPLQPGNADRRDVFVTKLNQDGSALIFSTYLGGNLGDEGKGIAVDEDGNVCVIGWTGSTNFPTVNPLQPSYAGGADAFVAKLKGDGSALIFSTYLGGNGVEQGWSLKVDNAGDIYVTGNTQSTNFPTKNPVQPANGGSNDAFVTKLKGDGSALIFSTYLGGSWIDAGLSVAVDGMGNVHVAGFTDSPNFPTANPLQAASAGSDDAFVAKLDVNGALVYSTYLGGAGTDYGQAIGVDNAGNAYLIGETRSSNFPTINPMQPALSGRSDIFVTKLNRTGTALVYSTYLGGTDEEDGLGLEVDPQGNVYITGSTFSTDFPTVEAVQPIPDPRAELPNTHSNGFVTKINAGGSGLIYSSYLGGKHGDSGTGIAVDISGNAYVVGWTRSEDIPSTPGAFQRELSPPLDPRFDGEAFIIKIRD
jgi:hypothetical protein